MCASAGPSVGGKRRAWSTATFASTLRLPTNTCAGPAPGLAGFGAVDDQPALPEPALGHAWRHRCGAVRVGVLVGQVRATHIAPVAPVHDLRVRTATGEPRVSHAHAAAGAGFDPAARCARAVWRDE